MTQRPCSETGLTRKLIVLRNQGDLAHLQIIGVLISVGEKASLAAHRRPRAGDVRVSCRDVPVSGLVHHRGNAVGFACDRV